MRPTKLVPESALENVGAGVCTGPYVGAGVYWGAGVYAGDGVYVDAGLYVGQLRDKIHNYITLKLPCSQDFSRKQEKIATDIDGD